VWTRLLEHWNSPSYWSKYFAAKKNRASETGGALHTGGSIATNEYALRMVYTLTVCICHIWTTFFRVWNQIKYNITTYFVTGMWVGTTCVSWWSLSADTYTEGYWRVCG